MKISLLEIINFRNLVHVKIQPGHKINVFYGQNGSGKTSLLEAIHYLGLARSFRTRNIGRLIREDSQSFKIISQLSNGNNNLPVGIERAKDDIAIRIAGKNANTLAELAKLLPLQLLNADAHLLLSSGPLVRRQFLDWGGFHVEPLFYSYWQRANRLLKQRNTLLKTVSNYKELVHWDEELTSCALILDQYRKEYIEQFEPYFFDIFNQLLADTSFKLHYYSGWHKDRPLSEVFKESYIKDKQTGYSHFGPQRADLSLKLGNVLASETMSQGQQKLAAYAFKLAQGIHLHKEHNQNCIFLIDDLASELDKQKRQLVCQALATLDTQVFVTCIDPETLPILLDSTNAINLFHVERGTITPAIDLCSAK